MTAMRRVALVLHALTGDDRKWMLEQFDMHERESLRSLLDELERLGLVRDPALARDAVGRLKAEDGAQSTAADAALDDASLRLIAALPPAEAVTQFVDEPAAVLACILSLHRWPWRSAVLDALGRAKREQVEAIRSPGAFLRGECGHALRVALVEELAGRLGTVHRKMPTVGRKAQWWRRFSWGRL